MQEAIAVAWLDALNHGHELSLVCAIGRRQNLEKASLIGKSGASAAKQFCKFKKFERPVIECPHRIGKDLDPVRIITTCNSKSRFRRSITRTGLAGNAAVLIEPIRKRMRFRIDNSHSGKGIDRAEL